MRRPALMMLALPLMLLPAAGGAQLGLAGGGGAPGILEPLGDIAGRLSLSDLTRMTPVQAAQTLLDARLERLAQAVRDQSQYLEFDDRQYPAVRGMVVATGLNGEHIARLRAAGFDPVRQDIEGLDMDFVQLQAPEGRSLSQVIRQARKIAPEADIASNPIYFQSGGAIPFAGSGAVAASQGIAGSAVGLIDGGVGKHPSMKGRIEQRGFARGAPIASEHGTAVASLIVGNGPVKGAAPGASLLVADIYGRDPAGGNAIAMARAMGWMASRGVRVVTVSLVGPDNPLLSGAVQAARRRGMIVVAAVGNDGPAAPPVFPASYTGVVAVTGVDGRNRALIEAGRALHLDYAAPGADMVAADIDGRASRVRGTSFAAPLVAGRLYRHLQRQEPAEALQALAAEARDLGKKGPDKVYGRGLVCGTCRNVP